MDLPAPQSVPLLEVSHPFFKSAVQVFLLQLLGRYVGLIANAALIVLSSCW